MTTILTYTSIALAIIAFRYVARIFDLVLILKGRKNA